MKTALYDTKRNRLRRLQGQMEIERSSFDSHAVTLAEYFSPRRSRYIVTDVNQGNRRNDKIIDNTGAIGLRTLAAGMNSGMTSQARRWGHLTVADRQVAESWAAKVWLDDLENDMFSIFGRSNLYKCFPEVYADSALFATSAMLVEPDPEKLVRFEVFPWGSYYISSSAKQEIDLFMRKFMMTVRQIVETFGMKDDGSIDWTNISPFVRGCWERGDAQREQWVEVVHVIYPNDEYREGYPESKYKKFASCMYESGAQKGGSGGNYMGRSTGSDTFLEEKGYDYFPVLVARWDVTGEDFYGTNSPCMMALGDVKQLFLMEKRYNQALEKLINPPMTADQGMKNKTISMLPGGVTYVPPSQVGQGVKPAYQINPDLASMKDKMQGIQQRINETLYKQTFLMFSNDPGAQPITAAEVAAREGEKLLQLGPVLERYNQDFLSKLIDITFAIMIENGYLDEHPVPPELQGMELKVEYVSIMAQAQKAAGLASMDRFWLFIQQMVQVSPTALDKVDLDQFIDEYAERTGIPRKLIIDDERVAMLREQKARQEQAMMQAQMIPAGAKAAKDLSQASLEGNNALTGLLEMSRAGQLARTA